jgi:hypothetical protein
VRAGEHRGRRGRAGARDARAAGGRRHGRGGGACSSTAEHDAARRCRYKSYCANVARTYLIDPPRTVSDAYAALLAAHAAARGALRAGARCADVHVAAAAALAAAPGGAAD